MWQNFSLSMQMFSTFRPHSLKNQEHTRTSTLASELHYPRVRSHLVYPRSSNARLSACPCVCSCCW
jgi:hypothetical protein